jgi:hypothetical protein
MPVTSLSRFGNLRCGGLANLRCGQIGHKKKEESIPGNVQIEIDQAMGEKPKTSHKSGELDGGAEGSDRLRETPQGIEEQDAEKPSATQAAGKTGFREAFEVIVVGVVDYFSIVERFVGGKDDLEGAKTGAHPGMVQENAPSVCAH